LAAAYIFSSIYKHLPRLSSAILAATFAIEPVTIGAMERDNRPSQLAGVMIAGFVVSLVVVSLRFWVRAKVIQKLGVDDWFTLVSFVSNF